MTSESIEPSHPDTPSGSDGTSSATGASDNSSRPPLAAAEGLANGSKVVSASEQAAAKVTEPQPCRSSVLHQQGDATLPPTHSAANFSTVTSAASQSPEASRTALETLVKLPEWLKQFSGLSVALYVFGFLIYRVRLNVLGITVSLPIADDRYLTGGGVFIAETAEALFPWAFTLLVFVSAAWLLTTLLCRLDKIARALDSVSKHLPQAMILLFYVCIVLVLSKVAHNYFSKVAIATHTLLPDTALDSGDMSERWLIADLHSHGHARDGLYSTLVAILGATVAVLWAALGRCSPLPPAPPALRWYLGFLLAFEVLLLPINYAVLMWTPQYPVVEIRTEPPIAALSNRAFLLLTTDKEMVLYAHGQIVNVDKASVKLLSSYCYANVLINEACPELVTGGPDEKRSPTTSTADTTDAGISDAAISRGARRTDGG